MNRGGDKADMLPDLARSMPMAMAAKAACPGGGYLPNGEISLVINGISVKNLNYTVGT